MTRTLVEGVPPSKIATHSVIDNAHFSLLLCLWFWWCARSLRWYPSKITAHSVLDNAHFSFLLSPWFRWRARSLRGCPSKIATHSVVDNAHFSFLLLHLFIWACTIDVYGLGLVRNICLFCFCTFLFHLLMVMNSWYDQWTFHFSSVASLFYFGLCWN